MKKTFVYVSTFTLLVLCFIVIGEGTAQTTAKPATPEFTVELVEKVIDQAPTYTIDPFSGETITKTEGYHATYWVVDIKIKNTDSHVFYNYRIKGHFGDVWAVCPLIENSEGVWSTKEYSAFDLTPHPSYVQPSSVEYAEIEVEMQGLDSGNQVDVQVQAISGTAENAPNGGYQILTGQGSDWSITKTLTVPDGSASIAPSPTVPEFPITTVVTLLFAMPVIAMVILRKKNK